MIHIYHLAIGRNVSLLIIINSDHELSIPPRVCLFPLHMISSISNTIVCSQKLVLLPAHGWHSVCYPSQSSRIARTTIPNFELETVIFP